MFSLQLFIENLVSLWAILFFIMRVLIVNTSENTGGAAVATNRLKDALNANGVQAKMLVRDRLSADPMVETIKKGWRTEWNRLWERWCVFWHLRFQRPNLFAVDLANAGMDITKLDAFQQADIIHLSWINQGMLSLNSIRKVLQSGKPIVWSMHDMWQLTGICHYAYTCNRYTESCGKCSFLGSENADDVSHRVFMKKLEVYSHAPIHFVAVSNWLADIARSSRLMKGHAVTTIPNVLSLQKFIPCDKATSRTDLGIPNVKVIAFGAARIDAEIKGLRYLIAALRHLVDTQRVKKDEVCLVLFGGAKSTALLDDIPVVYKWLGKVSGEDNLSKIYSAADVVVSSSMYETFGQTLIEALACGCVPVSFNNSGQRDIILHKQNGYLAQYGSAEDLAEGIVWAMNNPISCGELRNSVVTRYSESVVAQQYIELYNSILADKTT